MRAIAKGISVPPRKMSIVAALVRNRSVSDALTILEHTPRRAAKELHGIIKSAAANAENNHKQTGELEVAEIQVSTGGMLKRVRAGGRGMPKPYAKRMSNVRVILSGKDA